jgi:hypothetical protein
MRTSTALWVAFGAIVVAAGCAAAPEDIQGDLSGTDPAGSSSDEGGVQSPGSIGGGNGGNGSGGNSGSGSSDAGKGAMDGSHPGNPAPSTDAGTPNPGTNGSGGVPSTCAQADGQIGCCDPSGVLYYCSSTSKLTMQTCTAGNVCGWSTKGYYDCVPSPGGKDPSGTSPLACVGGSGGGTDAGTTTVDAGSGVTWTSIYNSVFGPSGTSTCAGSGCHSSSQSGFTCGSSKTTCYNGFVNSGLITPGANAPSSALVDPNQSPLCGVLGGNMPIGHSCVTSAQITTIKSWLAAGAANN